MPGIRQYAEKNRFKSVMKFSHCFYEESILGGQVLSMAKGDTPNLMRGKGGQY